MPYSLSTPQREAGGAAAFDSGTKSHCRPSCRSAGWPKRGFYRIAPGTLPFRRGGLCVRARKAGHAPADAVATRAVDRITEETLHGHFQQHVEKGGGGHAIQIERPGHEQSQICVLRRRRLMGELSAARLQISIDRAQGGVKQYTGSARQSACRRRTSALPGPETVKPFAPSPCSVELSIQVARNPRALRTGTRRRGSNARRRTR